MREAGFNGPWDRDGVRAWLERHPDIKEAIQEAVDNEMFAKLSRAGTIGDFKKVMEHIAAKPHIGRWDARIYADQGQITDIEVGCGFVLKDLKEMAAQLSAQSETDG
jgi:hypothetical protein